MSDRKWWLAAPVRIRVTFKYRGMSQADYDAWVVEESKAIRLADLPEFYNAVAAYGYDLFDVAWLNLWWYEDGREPNSSYASLRPQGLKVPNTHVIGDVTIAGRTLDVAKRVRPAVVRQATEEDFARLEANKKPNFQSWELVEREKMGVEWLRCHAADEAYEEDFASREERAAWQAHEWMVEHAEDADDPTCGGGRKKGSYKVAV